jgi:hypothetical protein
VRVCMRASVRLCVCASVRLCVCASVHLCICVQSLHMYQTGEINNNFHTQHNTIEIFGGEVSLYANDPCMPTTNWPPHSKKMYGNLKNYVFLKSLEINGRKN